MMTPDMSAKLKKSLITHEGYENKPYTDTVGKITIGIGYNLTDRGLDDDWIVSQFTKDLNYFYSQLLPYDWFNVLNEDRQVALIDMCFNLGVKTFLSFTQMIAALEVHDYTKAANDMRQSKWATQVGKRAADLAQTMETGTLA